MYTFPLEHFTGNFPVWSEQECNGSLENTIEHAMLVSGSETGESHCQVGLLSPQAWRVWLGTDVLLLGLDDLGLWLYWVSNV